MNRTPEQEAEWIAAMVELEEERGPIVPGGAQGGVVAKARREAAAAQKAAAQSPIAQPQRRPPAARPSAQRSRSRVRSVFQAIEKSDARAA